MNNTAANSLRACALLQLLLCAGCAEDSATKPKGEADAAAPGHDAAAPEHDAAVQSDAGASSAALFGAFTVKFIDAVPASATRAAKPASTSVIGKLLDAETPEAIVWELVDRAQGCELRTPRVPFCDPGCGGTATCVEDGQCADSPTAQDIGAIISIRRARRGRFRPAKKAPRSR
jgi:hypothetical protein